MKTNTMMRLASVLLVAVLLSTCAIAGTYAKYTSNFTGYDSARIAKWDIKVDTFDKATSASNEFDFDVFNTIYDTLADEDGAYDAEGDVYTDLIAPGTWGYFDLVITNDSEVNATFTLELTETMLQGPANAVSPILYSVDVVESVNVEAALPEADDMGAATNGEITTVSTEAAGGALNMKGGEVVIRIYWQWEFDATGNNDTALGLDGDTQIKVAASVTVDQVD